jgi:hypothetical protein
MIPETFSNPLQEFFWLPSVSWLLTYDTPVPEIGQDPWPQSRPELRRAALDLFLKNLSPDADRRLRGLAQQMLVQPQLRAHPEVIAAAAALGPNRYERVLPEPFEAELKEAVANDTHPKMELTPERLRNFSYFRDFVIPEMSLENRYDGNACFSCHGEKVPSMMLKAPNRGGFLSAEDTWINYRTLLERIDYDNPEQSRVIRKPLNVQTGEEDGHQGGNRYLPGDRGHEIITRWALDASSLGK